MVSRVLILVILWVVPAWATSYPSGTYYIDATGGSDASADPTNISTPWKTLSMINSNTFSAPTTIRLKKGETWNEYLALPSSGGGVGTEFTLTSYGTGAKPVVKRTGVITNHSATGWTNTGGGIWTYSLPGSFAWIYENGLMIKQASDATLADGNWKIVSSVLYYKVKTGTDPSSNLIEYSNGISVTASNISYLIIDGISFTQGAWWDNHSADKTNITIQNCSFTYMAPAYEPQAGNHVISNVTIKNNIFDYNDVNIYLANGNYQNAVIQDNVITHSNLTYWGEHTIAGTNDHDGISLQGLTNSTIQRNDISGGCWGYAGIFVWHGGWTETGNVITRNYIHDIEGGGIIDGGAAGTQNVTIAYNVIKNFGSGNAATYSLDGVAWGGLRIDKIQATNSLVANNTIYNGDVGIYLTSGSDYYTVQNNIIDTMSSYLVRNAYLILHNVFNHNLYYPTTGNPFYTAETGGATNWAGWTPYYTETGSLTSDPLLTGSLRLGAGSPAINAGTNVGLGSDYYGCQLNGLPDIGAIEKDGICGLLNGVVGAGWRFN